MDGRPQLTWGSYFERLYHETKNVFTPQRDAAPQLDSNEAPHPGTEGVSFEEALEKCPHLAQQHKNGSSSATPQPSEAPSRCPYKNEVSQEWPVRAVLTFIAYNVISAGVNMEVIKIAFVMCAYHMGMLHIPEFVVLYLTTATMSSYKLMGLLLMLTRNGGPVFSFKDQYQVTLRRLISGIAMGMASLLVMGGAMHWALYMEYFKKETESENIYFSLFTHVVLPIASEFVFRGYLLKELGSDLGAWFGVVGSSGWFCILQRGPASIKFIAFVHGVFWSISTLVMKENLVPTTIAHVLVAVLRGFYPALYFSFFPEKL